VGSHACRSCAGQSGRMVLDLGNQPACDHFPASDDRDADPTYPLQMWLCSTCGLAQLLGEPIEAEEPLGTEPEALVAQSVDAVERLAATGWLSGRRTVVEFPSPHGGSWLGLLNDRGLETVADGGPGDLVIDSFGMMHEPDQASALADRIARVAPGGVLLLQYHSLDTIIRLGQWNALRHGHFAYYSTSALAGMLEANGFKPGTAWSFELYGGTILLAACRESDGGREEDESVTALLSDDSALGVRDAAAVGSLQSQAEAHARGLHNWLASRQDDGRSVMGYGAASRAVALLCKAGVDRRLLPAVVDTSTAKHGLRMPGTDIPIVGPAALSATGPHDVLLFVPDLLSEVRRTFPEVEAAGGSWVDAEALRG
jgi:C-methyltransferase C-terminal domain/Putative zinc binding domain/Methyltransferase domain